MRAGPAHPHLAQAALVLERNLLYWFGVNPAEQSPVSPRGRRAAQRAAACVLGVLCVLLGLSGAPAGAQPIRGRDQGLAAPYRTIDFNGLGLVVGAVIDVQLRPAGVEFSGAYYNLPPDAGSPFQTAAIYNFVFGKLESISPKLSLLFIDRFSFKSLPVTRVAFNFTSLPGTATFTAFLAGLEVATFDAATAFEADNATKWWGFEGVKLDRIDISIEPDPNVPIGLFGLDNLQIGTDDITTVPEPAVPSLVALGAVALALTRRRRPKA